MTYSNIIMQMEAFVQVPTSNTLAIWMEMDIKAIWIRKRIMFEYKWTQPGGQ